ncbi:MAG TPA: fused MFS/spermidine synthase [Steroidobacteraceae bacterium]|nr:fused MFS/spermidine synthase [Steroidobacteraceae bacterium]
MGLQHQVQRLSAGGWRWRASLGLMLASGFAGLGYQIVWTQQSALWLGHESTALLAVITAFFGGMAVGAWVLGPRIERTTRPVQWYAGCEAAIACWSLLLAFAMSPWSVSLLRIIGAAPSPLWQWTLTFCGTFALLLPATAAMGATLPAMERLTARTDSGMRSIAPLYASNTFGAAIGVLAITFWLIPALGLIRTTTVCVVLNVLCSVASFSLFAAKLEAPRTPVRMHGFTSVLTRLALTGLLGIGYEVAVVRVLSQVAEDTVYTFALLLAVYLVGSVIGAASFERWLSRSDANKRGDWLLSALSIACLAGAATLWAAEYVKTEVIEWLGPSMAAALSAEAAMALIAFALPTVVMGALFSHLSAQASAAGVSFGRAVGANTVGAAAAPVVFGVLALPMLGPKLTLLVVAAGYWALLPPRALLRPVVLIPAGVTAVLALWAAPLAFIDVPEGGHVVSYQEGVMAAVSVVEDADGVDRLRINNRQQEGSSSTLRVDARQAWLPLLLHPEPRRVLFLGLGTGVTATSAARDPTIAVDAVELLPEVITASRYFTNGDDRLHIVAADARRYVRTSDQQYDVIVSDNFHPARSGSGSLYTVEHFEAVRDRLASGGVFCQWLPLHQLDIDTLRSIVRSFLTVYPGGWVMLASNSLETPVLGLVGRADNRHFNVSQLSARLARGPLPPELLNIGIEDEFALLGSFAAGPDSLRRFAGNAALNTDDRPIVAYRAPRVTYAPDSLPRERLAALLDELSIRPAELVLPATDDIWLHRLSAYWSARNQFIASGRDVRPSGDVRQMLAQVRGPLLSVLRMSPDFRPAYDPLVLMAGVLARTHVSEARSLLTELRLTQPARPEAAAALLELRDGAP